MEASSGPPEFFTLAAAHDCEAGLLDYQSAHKESPPWILSFLPLFRQPSVSIQFNGYSDPSAVGVVLCGIWKRRVVRSVAKCVYIRMGRTVSCGECGGGERIRMELCAGKTNYDAVRVENSVVVYRKHALL